MSEVESYQWLTDREYYDFRRNNLCCGLIEHHGVNYGRYTDSVTPELHAKEMLITLVDKRCSASPGAARGAMVVYAAMDLYGTDPDDPTIGDVGEHCLSELGALIGSAKLGEWVELTEAGFNPNSGNSVRGALYRPDWAALHEWAFANGYTPPSQYGEFSF